MEILLIFILFISIAWSCLCTYMVIKDEETITSFMNTIKELEKENNELADRIKKDDSLNSDINEEINWGKENE